MTDRAHHPKTITLIMKVELMRAAAGMRLPLYELKTLIILASLINQRSGLAYPPRSLIAAVAGINERHVSRAVRGLCARGLIEIAEPGTPARAARYRLHVDAVLGASGSTSTAPLKARQQRLYMHVTGTATGVSAVPPKAPEGQLSASEGQPKLATKLSAPRASAASPTGRLPPRAARSGNGASSETTRNSWRHQYASRSNDNE